MYVWETGLVPYWVQNVIPKAYACFDKNPQKTTSKPNAIKLVDLTSAFLILGVGLGLGIIFFIFEIMHYRFRARKMSGLMVTIAFEAIMRLGNPG